MSAELAVSPVTAFVLALIVAALVYAIGGSIAPKPPQSKGKLAPYACGEDFPAEHVPVSIHVFDYAALFMVFDIVAMMLALSMGLSSVIEPLVMFLALAYCLLVFVALLLLARRR